MSCQMNTSLLRGTTQVKSGINIQAHICLFLFLFFYQEICLQFKPEIPIVIIFMHVFMFHLISYQECI